MSRPLLLSCEVISMAYGTRSLFDDLSFGLFEGDQAGLVGPNGSGKSTLLKILAGITTPDRGSRSLRGGVSVGYVPQDPVFEAGRTVEEVVLAALTGVDEADRPGRAAQALGRAEFTDGRAPVDTLSGGWRKRLAIARQLAAAPDILLMDEPTNHLDVAGILWLEDVLTERARAFVVVSHDRYFLEHVATRMLELNRVYPAGLFESEGSYSRFLARRDEALREQAAYQDSLANTVRREIEWLRRGAKARSTKAKGRIKEAGRLIEELEDSRARGLTATAGIDFTSAQRRTRRLLVARGLTKSLGGHPLVTGLDLVITPGTRVGLIGPNGSGKTTLLNVLADELAPDAGVVERADGLRLVRFTQERAGLDPAQSLRRALSPEGDAVVWQGRSIHVASWAKRFLFRPEQLEVPVGRLSGGEQARILIARLMREPADVLILDEPTNDLDIPTLEVLEDSLAEFDGGLVLVTHDRFMLERVSTVILALDGKGGTTTFADYAQWEAAREAGEPAPRKTPGRAPERERPRSRRLGYVEQREWDGMEQAILDAELAVEACRRAADDPTIASDPAALQTRYAALEAAQAEVDRLYARWAELEAKQA
ncbi:MAG TPA: ABC-F family ATP-binding cassette domain-containing protein [Methylomirabilota bacterium]|jgi:ABC transport system ATP-binding/permease protein|nr:ABC-F family ATP-binding cassette domain-containing protein [Methylomirabilota bacterium]